ncbi:serine/arginine repetitive matrix protein 2-like [Lingula anatina]|uniref:Serine/arginine repetitive matrix protein 2-like n=1 Tax=Lingula anatina TaxID=7574 RepID=A0A1S3HN25_LINAN|nr:serine/arginine repetitive matrix protein 2-like [Lingula anatina]|eukprot:XP_013387460.1 serine/arginine repetitive matrix protein 2-like [Lingula anatina]
MRRSNVKNKGQGSSFNRTSGSLLDDSDDDQNELQAYLSSLTKKRAPAKSPDLSDISISSGDLSFKGAKKQTSTSKFLKNKADGQNNTEKTATKSGAGNFSSSLTLGGSLRDAGRLGNSTGSSALDKVAALNSKYGGKGIGAKKQPAPVLSDSDMEMDISLSDDNVAGASSMNSRKVLKERNSYQDSTEPGTSSNRFLKTNKQADQKKTPEKNDKENQKDKTQGITDGVNFPGHSSLTKIKSFEGLNELSDSDSHSLELGKSSGKFLKKKPLGGSSKQGITIPQAQVENETSSSESNTAEIMKGIEGISDISFSEEHTKSAKKTTVKSQKANREVHFDVSDESESVANIPLKRSTDNKAVKTSTPAKTAKKPIVFDSDEEELQEFIEGLSPTPTPDSAARHKFQRASGKNTGVESPSLQRSGSASSVSTIGEGPAFNLVTLDDILGDMEATPTAPLTKSKKNEEKDIQTKSNDQAKDKRPVPKPRKSKQDSVSVESPEPDPLSRMGLQTLDDVLDIDNDPSVPVTQSYLTKETKDESSSSSSEEIILDMSQQSDIVYENDFNKDRKSRPITPRSEAVTPKSEIVSEIKSEIQYQSDFERSQSRISPTPTPRSQSNRYSDDFEHSYQDKSDIGRSRSASPKRSRSNSRSSEQRSRSRSRTDRSSSGTTSLRSSFSQSVSSSSKTETSSRSRKKHKGSSRSPTSRKASYSPRGKHDRSKHKDSYSSSRSGTSKDDDYSRDSNTESYR